MQHEHFTTKRRFNAHFLQPDAGSPRPAAYLLFAPLLGDCAKINVRDKRIQQEKHDLTL